MKIKLGEVTRVANLKRKFGADDTYNVCYVKVNGLIKPLLLTDEALNLAAKRAADNREDIPKRKSFWGWL